MLVSTYGFIWIVLGQAIFQIKEEMPWGVVLLEFCLIMVLTPFLAYATLWGKQFKMNGWWDLVNLPCEAV